MQQNFIAFVTHEPQMWTLEHTTHAYTSLTTVYNNLFDIKAKEILHCFLRTPKLPMI